MKFPAIRLTVAAMAASMMLFAGCNNKWDDHYDSKPVGSEMTVYEMIASTPDLSVFKQMIDKAGYADLLNSSQTFTVWAPVNSALTGFDIDDEALVKRTIINHIARFNNSTSVSAEGVRMFNGKKFRYEGNEFGGTAIKDADILCRNGVLLTMDDVIPYQFNIREYIDTHDKTTELAKFLASFDEELFDLENSTPLDVNANGETVYDSVKIEYNRILDYPHIGLGPIANEDSTFTMIVPTDAAWNKAYAEIKPWFVAATDSITRVQTSLAVFSSLVFRGNYSAVPAITPLISTNGSIHTDVAALFGGATYETASNGSIWLTDNISSNPLETWNQPIEIEAETAATRKMLTSTKSISSTINVANDNQFAGEISEMSYIYVSSTSLDNAGAEFTINNPLSGKYKIYATFVPPVADNPSATEETTRLKFSVTYPRSATGTRTTTVNFTNKDFVTATGSMTEIYVGEVTFPASHFVDAVRTMSESYNSTLDVSNFKITVQTNVTQSEFNSGKLARAFRLDRIVLVPVI